MRKRIFYPGLQILFSITSIICFFYLTSKEIKIDVPIQNALKKITAGDEHGKPYELPKEKTRFLLNNVSKKGNCTFPNISKKLAKYVCKEYLRCKLAHKKGAQDCNNKRGKEKCRGICDRGKFEWCACSKARAYMRLYTILHLLNKVRHKDMGKPLVYVSFGSGRLLQDFLTIRGLIKSGFKKIDVHLIDIGYGNKAGLDIDLFFKTHYKQGEKKEKEALEALCNVLKKQRNIVTVHSYTSYIDFLKKWDKKPVDILLLVDPAKLSAELLKAENPSYANHVCAKRRGKQIKTDLQMRFLLPYRGSPEIFYKGDLSPHMKQQLLSKMNLYKNHKDKSDFIDFLHLFLKNKKMGVAQKSQSQRYAFYELITATKSKDALIYQVDQNKIFQGKLNLLIDAYKKEGYKILK